MTKREVKIVLGTVTAATLLLLAAAVFRGRFTPRNRDVIEDALTRRLSKETPPAPGAARREEPRTVLRVECGSSAGGGVSCSQGHRRLDPGELAKAAESAGVSLDQALSPEASFAAARQIQAAEVRKQRALIAFRNALLSADSDGGTLAPLALQTGGQKSGELRSALRYASQKAMDDVRRLRTEGEATRLRGAAAQERKRREAVSMAPAEAAAERLFAHATRPAGTATGDANMRRLYETSVAPEASRWWERLRWWSGSTPLEKLRNEYVNRAARGDSVPFPP